MGATASTLTKTKHPGRNGDYVVDTRTGRKVAFKPENPDAGQQQIPSQFQGASGSFGGQTHRSVNGHQTDSPQFFRQQTNAPGRGAGMPGLSPSQAGRGKGPRGRGKGGPPRGGRGGPPRGGGRGGSRSSSRSGSSEGSRRS